MAWLKVDLDKETAKQIRDEIFRPLILSLIVGLSASLAIALVASIFLGFRIQDGKYSFSLDHSDAWIIFTIFVTIGMASAVVAYYRLKEEHQKFTDDILTPFRKELEGEWRVYWTDLSYVNENGEPRLVPHTENDSCQFGIDNVGKLFIESELNNHVLLEDWKNRIEDISINLQKSRLTFYDESVFTIRREIMKNPDDERSFEAKFFVMLEAKEVDEAKRVVRYEGKWYDLDGTFARFKDSLVHQLHGDLAPDRHFVTTGRIEYVKAPRRVPA